MFKYVQTCLNHNSKKIYKTVIIFLKISSNSNAGGAGEGARGAGGRWTGGCSAARGTGSGEVG